MAPNNISTSVGTNSNHMAGRKPYEVKMRAKRATLQDMTRPLKTWLYKHRENPYPTKNEKMELCVESEMTLTQVSNWFANARRRLKNTVTDPELSWNDRVKMYNSHVKGNQELLSVTSEDSAWESGDEGDSPPAPTTHGGDAQRTQRTSPPPHSLLPLQLAPSHSLPEFTTSTPRSSPPPPTGDSWPEMRQMLTAKFGKDYFMGREGEMLRGWSQQQQAPPSPQQPLNLCINSASTQQQQQQQQPAITICPQMMTPPEMWSKEPQQQQMVMTSSSSLSSRPATPTPTPTTTFAESLLQQYPQQSSFHFAVPSTVSTTTSTTAQQRQQQPPLQQLPPPPPAAQQQQQPRPLTAVFAPESHQNRQQQPLAATDSCSSSERSIISPPPPPPPVAQGKYKRDLLQRYLTDSYQLAFSGTVEGRHRNPSGSLSSHDFEDAASSSSRSTPTKELHPHEEASGDYEELYKQWPHTAAHRAVTEKLSDVEISAVFALTALSRGAPRHS